MVNSVTEAILSKLDALVVIINNQGQVDYVSPASQKILGYMPDELLGEGWYSLTRPNDAERLIAREFVNELIARERMIDSLNYERILISSQGIKKWILWTTTKAEGKVIGIGQDITERKKAEIKLLERNNLLGLRNKDIEESLHYARTIQESMLSDITELKRNFDDSFVFYSPKDVVSGDFYFFHTEGDLFYAAAIDCTGHGVPGAMMSVLGHSLLKDIVTKEMLTNPKEIIERLDAEIHLALNKNNDNPRSDGMDAALVVIDKSMNKLSFCGALRPAIISRNNSLIEIKPSKYPVGFYQDIKKEFVVTEMDLLNDDVIYLFSDGYIDQFGGERDKKFNKRNFKDLLDSAATMTVEEQGSYLEYVHKNWKQDGEQTDDILVIGFRYGSRESGAKVLSLK